MRAETQPTLLRVLVPVAEPGPSPLHSRLSLPPSQLYSFSALYFSPRHHCLTPPYTFTTYNVHLTNCLLKCNFHPGNERTRTNHIPGGACTHTVRRHAETPTPRRLPEGSGAAGDTGAGIDRDQPSARQRQNSPQDIYDGAKEL